MIPVTVFIYIRTIFALIVVDVYFLSFDDKGTVVYGVVMIVFTQPFRFFFIRFDIIGLVEFIEVVFPYVYIRSIAVFTSVNVVVAV